MFPLFNALGTLGTMCQVFFIGTGGNRRMKTIKRTQMECFEGETLQEFRTLFNARMAWLASTGRKHSDPVIDLSALRGYVVYEEVDRTPECVKDELILADAVPTCSHCKLYDSKTRSCKYCKGGLRDSDECCDTFFKALNNGDSWLNEGGEKLLEKLQERRTASVRPAKPSFMEGCGISNGDVFTRPLANAVL